MAHLSYGLAKRMSLGKDMEEDLRTNLIGYKITNIHISEKIICKFHGSKRIEKPYDAFCPLL